MIDGNLQGLKGLGPPIEWVFFCFLYSSLFILVWLFEKDIGPQTLPTSYMCRRFPPYFIYLIFTCRNIRFFIQFNK